VTQSQHELYCSYGNTITVAIKGDSITHSITNSQTKRNIYSEIKWDYIHYFRMKALSSSEKPAVCILAKRDNSVGMVTRLWFG
jgi:hypothetical protein